MACASFLRFNRTWFKKLEMKVIAVYFLLTLCSADPKPQLDLPPLRPVSNTQNPYGYGQVSTSQRPINSPGNQYDVSQNPNYFSTQRPGVYQTSSTPIYNRNQGISPDITNNGYPSLDYTNTGSNRNFNDRDERIDVNNDPNFRRNDPNFMRNDPNYVGASPYDPNNFNLNQNNLNAQNNPNFRDPNNPNFRDPNNPNFRDPNNPNFRDPNNPNYVRDPNNPNGFNRDPNSPNSIDDRFYQRDIQQIRSFLAQADEQASAECTNNVAAQWNFETDVSDVTQHAALDAQQRYTLFQRGLWEAATLVPRGGLRDFNTFRQLRMLSIIGPAALPPDQLDRYNRLINDMLAVYNSAEICAYNEPFKCGLHLQPELQGIMSHSRDWDELQHTWTEWRRVTGRRIRDLYEQLVDLTNQAARLNNFTDAAAYWMYPYESTNFRQDVEDVWEQIKPLYELLHAYVRRRLREAFGPERISRSAPLPAHVLGDMWGQSWTGILPFTLPYPGKTLVDVTPEMIQQGYTPLTVFQLAEEFFVSMNMSALPPDFWALSVLQQPPDHPVHCQPSAWDFCNKHDFRIKMCTHVDMKDLITAHHEMAHVQYFQAYRNQPKVFRDGANPGFHEAIGETIALSVSTPRHLQTLGLVQKSVDDTAHDINYLMTMAMDKLAFLPFALVMDKWRWDVFSGDVRKEQYNCHWWRLREQYSGVKPPVLRSELDFDPGSKYHIPANIPYIRYFVSTVLQFQLHRALCTRTGQYIPGDPQSPLHKCDIYRNPEAGRILTRIMERGSSVPWTQVLEETIGESRLDGQALREYFQPLEDWLRSENLRTGEYVGWSYDGDYCKFSIETAGLQVYGGFYNAAPTVHVLSLVTLMLTSTIITVLTSCRYR